MTLQSTFRQWSDVPQSEQASLSHLREFYYNRHDPSRPNYADAVFAVRDVHCAAAIHVGEYWRPCVNYPINDSVFCGTHSGTKKVKRIREPVDMSGVVKETHSGDRGGGKYLDFLHFVEFGSGKVFVIDLPFGWFHEHSDIRQNSVIHVRGERNSYGAIKNPIIEVTEESFVWSLESHDEFA